MRALFFLFLALFLSTISNADISTTTTNIDTDFNGATSVIAVDLDQDGDIDIVGTANNNDATVDLEWWQNDGAENFTENNIDTDFNGATSVEVIDLDFDGDLDIVGTANNNDNTVDVEWWESDGTPAGGWVEHNIVTDFNAANSVFTIDLNQDGDIDVIGTANNNDNSVDIAWWANDANLQSGSIGFNAEAIIEGSFNGARSVYATDLDIDGDIDVIGTSRLADDIIWWENDGSPSDGGWTGHVVNNDFEGAFDSIALDLDIDGDIDIVAVAETDDEVAWWENDGSQAFTKRSIDNAFNGANSLFVIDLDTDGDLDIVATAGLDDDLAWWSNDGTPADGGWTKSTVDGDLNGASDTFCVDLDTDGDIDILATADVDDDLAWWENSGAEVFTKRTIDDDFNGAASVKARDMDADGDIDVIACANNGNTISWWANDGTPANGGWTEFIVDGGVSGASDIFIIDQDLDGDIDIVSSAKVEDNIAWWENDGTPLDGGWTEYTIDSDFDGATSVFALDLDRDGDIDVLGAAESGDDISWWENGGAALATAPTTEEGATPFLSVDFTTLTTPTEAGAPVLPGEEPMETEEELQEIDVSCFIATASFGTPHAAEIKALCRFRDEYLIRSGPGRNLTSLYYKISPPLARAISKNVFLKKIVRVLIRILLKVIPT